MKIGIFGGTFDPPHIGHFILTMDLVDRLDLKRVYWVLTPHPPHKPDREITALDVRLDMLQPLLDDEACYELSRVDMDRPPPHYAADTVKIFRERYPEDELVYLMGEDSLRDLLSWERPEGFISCIDTLAVFSRPGVEPLLGHLADALEGIPEKLHLVDGPLIQISSSDIRHRVQEGRPYRYFLPPAVYARIEEQQLYR